MPITNAPKGKNEPTGKAHDTPDAPTDRSPDVPGSTNGDQTLGDASKGSGSPGTPANTPASAPVDTPTMERANVPANEPAVTGAAVDADYAAFLAWKRQNAAQDAATISEDDREVYAHLADGSVERVKARDLSGAAGTNAQYGYHERDGKVYQVVAVYDVEHDA